VPGHRHVGQQNVSRFRSHDFQGRLGVLDVSDAISPASEQPCEKEADAHLIVDDENCGSKSLSGVRREIL